MGFITLMMHIVLALEVIVIRHVFLVLNHMMSIVLVPQKILPHNLCLFECLPFKFKSLPSKLQFATSMRGGRIIPHNKKLFLTISNNFLQ